MKIAIVILNWNGKQLLEQFLPSVVSHSIDDAEVYVADNNSSDDSIAFIKENFQNVKIIQNNINGGYAKGYNDALRHIDADVYCLLNSDVSVTKNWIKPIMKEFKENPKIAAIQPKILDYKNKVKFEYAGAAGGYIDSLGYPYCRGRIFTSLETDDGQYDTNKDIFWASGACFFVRSHIFHQLNGFDEGYFAHQEEIDFCWRIQHTGHRIRYVADSIVYHVGGATLSNSSPKKSYLNFRNSLFTLVKNVPKKKLFGSIFLRMCLDLIAVIKFIFELKPWHAWAVLKAHISFYKHLSYYLSKRKEHINKKEDYFHSMSIVWKYFIARKTRFDQLD